MRWSLGLRSTAILVAAFWAAASLGLEWERQLVVLPVGGMALYGQASAGAEDLLGTQHLRSSPDGYAAFYFFRNFNQDRLTIEFQLKKSAFQQYESLFGYYKKDIAEIDAWHNTARTGAYQYGVKQHKTQAQLDSALRALQAERDKRVRDYMSSRGFRLLPGNVVSVDVPGVVKRNGPLLNSVAQAFDRIAVSRDYDSESIIGAAASMIQTSMIYREPPTIESNGRHTGGILQPAVALIKGWGDCDTKTALLASLLSNWPQIRMVGVAVPGHYLMAVLKIPNKGDAYVEHEGVQYVLVEPAGPAWLTPGTVAQNSIALLESSDGYRIDPFF